MDFGEWIRPLIFAGRHSSTERLYAGRFGGTRTDYGCLSSFDGRPDFRGRRIRPTNSRYHDLERHSNRQSSPTTEQVSVVEERLLSAIVSLRNVMGQPRNDQSCQSSHAWRLPDSKNHINNSWYLEITEIHLQRGHTIWEAKPTGCVATESRRPDPKRRTALSREGGIRGLEAVPTKA